MKKLRAISVDGENVILDPHHAEVLRLKEGEFVKALLPDGRFAIVEVIEPTSKVGKIQQVIERYEKDWKITVGISLLKKQHNETAVKFLSLLGVQRIIPLISRRVEVKLKMEKKEKFRRRLERLSIEFAKISGAPPPAIDEITHISKLNPHNFDVKMVFWEKSTNLLTPEVLLKIKQEIKKGSILFIVGPEGGFDDSEIDFLRGVGFSDYSAGDLIITAEMFPIYIASILDFFLNVR